MKIKTNLAILYCSHKYIRLQLRRNNWWCNRAETQIDFTTNSHKRLSKICRMYSISEFDAIYTVNNRDYNYGMVSSQLKIGVGTFHRRTFHRPDIS